MKTEFKGTKGEWVAVISAFVAPRVRSNGSTLCNVLYRNRCKDECKYNAQLIAAAPELLEALISIENDNGSIPNAIWELRTKAIKKALGL